MPDRNDDFYIGYKPRTSRAIAWFIRITVVQLAILIAIVAFSLVRFQRGFSEAVFEFGNVKEFVGILTTTPYPTLLFEDGSGPHLLVEFGKRGVSRDLSDLDGRPVRLSGQLIYRDEGRMIELTDGAIEATGGATLATDDPVTLGRQTLIGEIVDGKCFLGVMKPGSGKPHRSCAVRCISGGVPPALLVRSSDGSSHMLVLSADDGEPLGPRILDLVGRPVEVTGEVFERNDLWQMRTSPASISAWPGGES
jgi:hypothetical protein